MGFAVDERDHLVAVSIHPSRVASAGDLLSSTSRSEPRFAVRTILDPPYRATLRGCASSSSVSGVARRRASRESPAGAVQTALAALAPTQRALIEGAFFEGYTHREL